MKTLRRQSIDQAYYQEHNVSSVMPADCIEIMIGVYKGRLENMKPVTIAGIIEDMMCDVIGVDVKPIYGDEIIHVVNNYVWN